MTMDFLIAPWYFSCFSTILNNLIISSVRYAPFFIAPIIFFIIICFTLLESLLDRKLEKQVRSCFPHRSVISVYMEVSIFEGILHVTWNSANIRINPFNVNSQTNWEMYCIDYAELIVGICWFVE